MCDNCSNITLRDFFHSPTDYMNCLAYIQELRHTGNFTLVEKSCDLDKTKDDKGFWVDDFIVHVVQCKNCGKHFTCSIDTYHGRGSFRKGK